MHTTNGNNPHHPDFCDRERCSGVGMNLHHRSTPFLFVPRQVGTTDPDPVEVSIERVDEIEGSTGRQVEHPTEAVFRYDDGRTLRWGLTDLCDLTSTALTIEQGAMPAACVAG